MKIKRDRELGRSGGKREPIVVGSSLKPDATTIDSGTLRETEGRGIDDRATAFFMLPLNANRIPPRNPRVSSDLVRIACWQLVASAVPKAKSRLRSSSYVPVPV